MTKKFDPSRLSVLSAFEDPDHVSWNDIEQAPSDDVQNAGVYRYLLSGMDDIYLHSGYQFKETSLGTALSFTDLDGLHMALARDIVRTEGDLTEQEQKYLRNWRRIEKVSPSELSEMAQGRTKKRTGRGRHFDFIDGTWRSIL